MKLRCSAVWPCFWALQVVVATCVSSVVSAADTPSSLVNPILNREIQVSVKAAWPSAPSNILCEAHAFLKDARFLEELVRISPVSLSTYPEATQMAVQLAHQAGLENPLLKLALTLRAQSPTCELHRTLAQEYNLGNEAFVAIQGQVYSEMSLVPSAETGKVQPEEASLFLIPKEVPSRKEAPLAILYVDLGSQSFKDWYGFLQSKGYGVIVRHLGSQPTSQHTALQGYGVRLDIRNVEYKVFNENTLSDEEQAAAMVNPMDVKKMLPQFLAGVNLTALGVDDVTLQSELWKQHQAQQQHTQLIPPAWQRRKLGLQAATVISLGSAFPKHSNNNNDELMLLQEVSQNLPSVASTLVHVPVPESVQNVSQAMEPIMHMLIRQSGGGLFINGKPLVVERGSFNVFEMLLRLSEEQEWLNQLQSLPLPMAAREKLQEAWMMGEEFFGSGEEGGNPSKSGQNLVRIDVKDGEEGAVIYLNDIEKDAAYEYWPNRLEQALMAMQYGMPPTVRRNLFTMLLVENPLEPQHLDKALGRSLAMQLMQGQFPLRMAVLMVDNADVEECKSWVRSTQPAPGKACPSNGDSWLDKKKVPSLKELQSTKATTRDLHRIYMYIAAQFKENSRETLQACDQYLASFLVQNSPGNGEYYTLFEILNLYSDILVNMHVLPQRIPPVDLAKVLQTFDEEEAGFSYEKGLRFAADKSLNSGMAFLNGRLLPRNDDVESGEEVSKFFMEEQQAVFTMVMRREISDTSPKDVYGKILSKKAKNVFPKIHPLFNSPTEEAYLDWNPGSQPDFLFLPESMKGKDPSKQQAVVVLDAVLALDTPEGKNLASQFLKAASEMSLTIDETPLAIAYRVFPSTESAAASLLCNTFASASKSGTTDLLKALNKDKGGKGSNSNCSELPHLKSDLPSKNFLVASGRYYNLEESGTVDASDLELLISVHLDRIKPVSSILEGHVTQENIYEATSRATSFLCSAQIESGNRLNPIDKIMTIEKEMGVEENPLRFTWNGDCGSDQLRTSILAVVDPITESAQRLSPLLQMLRDELKLPLTVILSPTTEIDSDAKIPTSSYYRFVADSNVYQGSEEQHSPLAHFTNLPEEHVFTVRMDVPEPWDVQQTQAVQDTDNLRCSLQSGCSDDAVSENIPSGFEMWDQRHLTRVEYGLEHLLFAGQCYETNAGPPNGLQLTLSKRHFATKSPSTSQSVEIGANGEVVTTKENDSSGPLAASRSYYSDTVVMKTVGYWQLRANPGVWDLNILKGSRGADMFDMMDGKIKGGVVKVDGTNQNNNTKRLIMGDFVNQHSTLLVQRKSGYEKASIFADDDLASSEEDVVHVFSLATGHLYERLLKIMMLSVTKRTSSKVKFWLFENYLSPTFKNSAKAMAEKIGCEVEFVTYKWPEWLRGQTEKQRIIWGYKILFLDVLFPLNVKKIIYVDADQVVRGDLKELRDMDLQGAPYGYTPMCDSRESTIGYAFWRTGFWASHLRGKPYHISALYVVDLERFRKTLVGDQLRALYQQLSADPNSLANLDQDLPNFAQHQVPIFSLPQEWLWCESWCSDETKAAAKTIDLCNNPLHKEPKLSMAKRVISGELFEESWEELDMEVQKYDTEYFESISATA